MPNRVGGDKTRFPGMGRVKGSRTQGAKSVKELLKRPAPALIPLNREAAQQAKWRGWLTERLPAPLALHVTGAHARRGELVIFTDSAPWSARLRYALAEMEQELKACDPPIARVSVKVLPGKVAP